MRALTAAELAILKSRFMAGADGHRQQVKLTARVLAAAPATPRNPDMPWVTKMPNGQAALLFRADNNAAAPADLRVFFFAYQTEHAITRPIALFPYNTLAYGLVVWNAQLLAICRDPATGNLRYRTSPDSGATWTAEAALGALSYAAAEASWGGGASPSFQLATNKAGTALYLFTKNAANNQLMYRTTASADPTHGLVRAHVQRPHHPEPGPQLRRLAGRQPGLPARVHRLRDQDRGHLGGGLRGRRRRLARQPHVHDRDARRRLDPPAQRRLRRRALRWPGRERRRVPR